MNVCFESNIIDVPSDTWWLDSGATIHACNSIQVVICRRSPTSLEQYVYMGNGIRVQVDFLGGVRLQLRIGIFFGIVGCGVHTLDQEKYDISTYFG